MEIFSAKTSYDSNNRIWSGAKKISSKQFVGETIVQALLSNPDHINQICFHNGKEYTNQEMANLSMRASQNFHKLGLKQGDVMALCASNSDFLAPLYIGALLNGMPISALDPSFDKDGIKHIYGITKPKIMLCDGNIYDKVKQSFDECKCNIPIYTLIDHREGVPSALQLLAETGEAFKFPLLRVGVPAILLCSSGTTGLPKAVTISHDRLLNHEWNLSPSDKWLCFSTVYWATGLLSLICGSIAGVTRIINQTGFTPEIFFGIISKYKVNIVLTPPSQLALCVASPFIADFDLTSVATYISTGGATAPHLIDKIKLYMPKAEFYTGYGMSEVATFASMGPITPLRSTGQLVPNMEMKVINEDGDSLPPNETGEICVRTPQRWGGYYNNAQATNDVYDAEGWYTSGDLGHFDDDGNLYIVDRKKDILKYNNFHYSPTEIESVIMELPDVSEVCVFGVPDPISAFLPAALVVKIEGSDLSEETISDYVAEKMAHFKQLRGGVYFRDYLPKTASGKILRRNALQICCGSGGRGGSSGRGL